MRIEWSDDFATGLEKVDNQHKGFFEFMEKIQIPVDDDVDKRQLLEDLDYLKEYAIKHFDEEEQLMEKHGFPGLDDHAQLHVDFIMHYSGLVKDYGKEGPTREMAEKVVQMAGSWLVDHITRLDKQYAEFIRNS